MNPLLPDDQQRVLLHLPRVAAAVQQESVFAAPEREQGRAKQLVHDAHPVERQVQVRLHGDVRENLPEPGVQRAVIRARERAQLPHLPEGLGAVGADARVQEQQQRQPGPAPVRRRPAVRALHVAPRVVAG